MSGPLGNRFRSGNFCRRYGTVLVCSVTEFFKGMRGTEVGSKQNNNKFFCCEKEMSCALEGSLDELSGHEGYEFFFEFLGSCFSGDRGSD